MTLLTSTDWLNCYPSLWKGTIVPESMAHPAKYSSRLIRRIYEHMTEEGWLKRGDHVLDPFGGVALGALDAMRFGLHWNGVELEEKFHTLGNQNIASWISRFGSLPNWGSAHLMNGDSRRLLELLNGSDIDCTVSSPPYADSISNDAYGDSTGQLGNESGDDFWLAARQIVDQVYIAIKPGGHAVWVVKNYVKEKQIVPFTDQWRQLCKAAGFETLHEHHAMLVHHRGTQHTLEGGMVHHQTESKSFFRRLAEKKGSPRIDYETVFCMVKQ